MIGYVVTGQENDGAVSHLLLSVEKHNIADPIQFKINLFRKFGLSKPYYCHINAHVTSVYF